MSDCVYSIRSRDGREYVWHAVWSLILLLYVPLVHTCLSLLHCPYTPNIHDGDEEAVSISVYLQCVCTHVYVYLSLCVYIYIHKFVY